MNMSMFTIQCRLCASEETRRDFWQWMENYTLLVNELLETIAQHPQFQEWQKKGDISRKAVEQILKPLKENPRYQGLPGRFYTSAGLTACDTYKSWLALQKERQLKIIGKQRWLQAVESEFELSATTDFNPNEVRAKAGEVLEKARQSLNKPSKQQQSLIRVLLDMHERTAEAPLTRRAINHLLINDLQIREEEQGQARLSQRLDKQRVEIRRLEEQLTSRLPKGRDPTGERYLKILSHITAVLDDNPQELEAELDELTEQKQIPLFKPLPYSIRFDSSGDLYWSVETQDPSNSSAPEQETPQKLPKRSKFHQRPPGRIHLRFKGARDHTFKIQCGRRQLPIFRQFLVDYQTHQELPSEKRFSEGLFALRSARLIWRKEDSQPGGKHKRTTDKPEDPLKPWNTHRLYLHCTVHRLLLTAEGTEQVQQAKKNKTIQALERQENLEQSELEQLGLTKTQIQDVARKRSQLHRLEHNSSPPRPSIKPYQGHPNIRVGVSFSRHEPVTIALVDVEQEEALECQSAKELLNRGEAHYIRKHSKKELLSQDGTERRHPNGGKLYIRKGKRVRYKPHRLVQQLHQRHQRNLKRRAKQQQQNRYRSSNSDSHLGLYLDRLIASKIVALAVQRRAGTIVIPQLKGIRESVESDIRAQAERKFPNEKERQKEYAKHYRSSFHRWSYARLSECIKQCATSRGIAVVERKQSCQGDLEQKATAIALSSYQVKTS